ncbi:hypothetical protein KR032_002459, partial [Drosophila birchii]
KIPYNIFIIPFQLKTETRLEFTNFVCTSYDKNFGEFEYCYLKSINRSNKYISGKCNAYQLPITKGKVGLGKLYGMKLRNIIQANFGLWKRFNGYKPFLHNITLDACAFFQNPKSNPVANFYYGTIRDYTNLNHTCPLYHGVILDKLPIDFVNYRLTRVLPFPTGDYLIKIHWLVGNFLTASAKVYATLS